MRKILLLLVVVAVALGVILFQSSSHKPAPAVGSDKVHTYVLNNGLKILAVENKRAPVVVSQIWYKVGSSYEPDGITGISHVLEHMMFKGTPKHPAGQFSQIIAANGGRENAFTSKDYTAYFQMISNKHLALCLDMEADRMRNLSLKEGDFARELQVVKEERRMRTVDVPTALTYQRFNAVFYTNNPYRHPIIGWKEDLDSMTIQDVRKWYKEWYAPNNATLVVVGDIDPNKVFELARKYFGSLKPSVIPKLKPRHEVKQLGPQRVTVRVPAKVPYIIMGYKVPVLATAKKPWQAYALEVLAGLLDGGNSARLQKNLVRGRAIASSVNVSYDLYTRQESGFLLSAVPANKVSTDVIEAAFKEQIQNIQKTPPSQKELNRVIAQVIASNVYDQDSNFYQAMELGMLETVGLGWQKKDEYVAGVRAVTPEQVQAVAKKYFVDNDLTVAVLDPLPTDKNTVMNSAPMGVRNER